MNKNNLGAIGVCGFIGLHSLCCGLPLVAAMLGAVSPVVVFIPEVWINVLLLISVILVVFLWVNYLRGCKCNKTLLIISTVLLTISLGIHFVLPIFSQDIGAGICH